MRCTSTQDWLGVSTREMVDVVILSFSVSLKWVWASSRWVPCMHHFTFPKKPAQCLIKMVLSQNMWHWREKKKKEDKGQPIEISTVRALLMIKWMSLDVGPQEPHCLGPSSILFLLQECWSPARRPRLQLLGAVWAEASAWVYCQMGTVVTVLSVLAPPGFVMKITF